VRVLVVEDDARIASFIEKGLRAEGFGVDVAATADDADASLRQRSDVDVVLLDLGLPGRSGEDVLRVLRRNGSSVPVIVLTARAEVSDKVRGLDAGANDYVTKPFAFEELLARVRAVLRTTAQPDSRRIELSPREWALLELFMRQPTRVLSRPHILGKVWQYDMDPGTNVVDVYVGYLRRKINVAGTAPLITTVRGAGYRLVDP
jgi:DNA-binding response OmpR family regulator